MLSLTFAGIGLYFFVLPAALIVRDLWKPAVREGAIPAAASRWHQRVSPRFEIWARERIGSPRAEAGLGVLGVAGTEWPLFSAVFYLWSTEELENSWRNEPNASGMAPSEYASGAIEAAALLLTDPVHATWVKSYWGEDYLQRENLFYRMLLIQGLCSYQRLTGNRRFESMLVAQATGLRDELDRSPSGLLDDYPGQCYPIDVVPAIAGIDRSLTLLGLRDRAFVQRSRRAFEGDSVDPSTGLPAYFVDADSGRALSRSSGVGAAYMTLWASELWPDAAKAWYDSMERHHWRQNFWVAGVREKPIGVKQSWYAEDVDAGPVVFGFGTAASAFGIGAARAQGRMDHALPLMAEAMVAAWPLPDGTLLLPRLFAQKDAPLMGEVALLFAITRPTAHQTGLETDGMRFPTIVYLALGIYLLAGFVFLRWSFRIWKGRRTQALS